MVQCAARWPLRSTSDPRIRYQRRDQLPLAIGQVGIVAPLR